MKHKAVISIISAASAAASALVFPAAVNAGGDELKVYYSTWQEAYFNVIRAAAENVQKYDFDDTEYGSRYELYDIDSDGTPELFISESTYRPAAVDVYTYYDGHISDNIEIGVYGQVFCADTAPYLVYDDTHMGYRASTYYELKDGKFVHLASFSDNTANAEHEEVYYNIGGKPVSETEYVQAREQFDHLELIAHGRRDALPQMQVNADSGVYRYCFDHYALSGVLQGTEHFVIADTINGLPVTEIMPYSIRENSLLSVKFGKNVKTIAERALTDIPDIQSVELNDGIEKLGGFNFINCPKLLNISGPATSETYCCADGMVFYSSRSNLKVYPSARNEKNILVPKYAENVLNSAFANNENIETITFSPETKSVGEGALAYCKNLKCVTFLSPDTVIKNPDFITDSFTICSGTEETSGKYVYDGTIRGYKGSTAEEYANAYGIKFEAIDYKQIEKTGDVNNDGAVNSVDASAILSEYAAAATGKTTKFNEMQFYAADIDSNGKADSVDASKILSYYSYISTHDDNITIDEFFSMAQ